MDRGHVHNTFGCKPIVEYKGEWMFAELAVRNMLIDVGWSAQWIEGRYYLERWDDVPFGQQKKAPLQRLPNWQLISKIDAHCSVLYSKHRRNSCDGCWDVLTWNGAKTLFIELKRYQKDRITLPQKRWLSSALSPDLISDKLMETNFLVIEWKYKDDDVLLE